MTTNLINYWNLQETKRANKAREDELRRHQLADERIRDAQNKINLQLGEGNLRELNRSNLARETELNRSNMAKEDIQKYSNLLNAKELPIKSSQAKTAAMDAQTRLLQTQELQRSNLENEKIKRETLAENSRHNLRSENLTNFKNVADLSQARAQLSEQKRHSKVTEGETKRKNLVDQYLRTLELRNAIEQGSARIKADIFNSSLSSTARMLGGRVYGQK